jgi:hypothetical protein
MAESQLMRERWESRLREDGSLTVRRSRRPTLVFLAFAGLLLALGAWLASLGGVTGIIGTALALLGLLAVFLLGMQVAHPGIVVRIDEDGVEPAGRQMLSWREFDGVEIREEAGGLLVLRVKPAYTKRTEGKLGRVGRWARKADQQQFGSHRIRLRTSTPKEAEELAELLCWARQQKRQHGSFSG